MTVLALIAAFLVGSLPLSWGLVWLLRGIDLRTVGSGNPGATNALRVMGTGWGLVALALDISKGVVAVLVVPMLATPDQGWLPAVCGLLAMLGNIFTPFLRFRGGKAVATGAGVFGGLTPLAFAGGLLSFGIVLGMTRKVSIGSLVAAMVLAGLVTGQWWGNCGDTPGVWELGLVWLGVVLVFWRHRENISRLLTGEEAAVTDRI